MDFFITLSSLLLIFIILPVCVGSIFNISQNKDAFKFLVALIYGFIFMLAIYELLYVPLIFVNPNHDLLSYTWLAVVVTTSIILFVLRRREIFNAFKNKFHSIKKINPLFIVALILILFQAFMLSYYMHEDIDDAQYIGSAVYAYSMNDFRTPMVDITYGVLLPRYAFASLSSFYATLSKFTDMHPAILAHTVVPFIFIIYSYIVYYLIAKKIFPKNSTAQALLLIILSVLNIFGNTSVYTQSTFMLIRIWQGKALLASFIIPLLLLIFLNIESSDEKKYWFALFVCTTAACAASSMGVILSLIIVTLFIITDLIIRRKPIRSLYFSGSYIMPAIISIFALWLK